MLCTRATCISQISLDFALQNGRPARIRATKTAVWFVPSVALYVLVSQHARTVVRKCSSFMPTAETVVHTTQGRWVFLWGCLLRPYRSLVITGRNTCHSTLPMFIPPCRCSFLCVLLVVVLSFSFFAAKPLPPPFF